MHIIAILFANHPLHTGMGSIATKLLEVTLRVGWNRDLPIHWDKEYALLLKPNGSMLEVDVPQRKESSHTRRGLRTATTDGRARHALQAEFGQLSRLQPSAPTSYARRVSCGSWRERFRVLLAGYRRYFETRGWQLPIPTSLYAWLFSAH